MILIDYLCWTDVKTEINGVSVPQQWGDDKCSFMFGGQRGITWTRQLKLCCWALNCTSSAREQDVWHTPPSLPPSYYISSLGFSITLPASLSPANYWVNIPISPWLRIRRIRRPSSRLRLRSKLRQMHNSTSWLTLPLTRLDVNNDTHISHTHACVQALHKHARTCVITS